MTQTRQSAKRCRIWEEWLITRYYITLIKLGLNNNLHKQRKAKPLPWQVLKRDTSPLGTPSSQEEKNTEKRWCSQSFNQWE